MNIPFAGPTIGCAYYNEYLSEDRLPTDIALMRETGIQVVRLGESVWSLFEPDDGIYCFDWMDRIIDAFHAADIRVIFGLPTYSVPAWLAKRVPEILTEDIEGRRKGFGHRQNFDYTHPAYLFYAERISRQLLARYAAHPAVVGFQIDNETAIRGTTNLNFFRGFVDHVRRRFGTVEALNKAWGMSFWGMTLSNWDQFPSRSGISNPSYIQEWNRYSHIAVTRILALMASWVRDYQREDQFIVHNYFGWLRSANQYQAVQSQDVVGVDIYHETQDRVTPESVMWADDFFRSLKNAPHLVMETNPHSGGWNAINLRPPYDGQTRLYLYSHFASGARSVLFWNWHSIHFGCEAYFKGILGHDLEPSRISKEISQTAKEIRAIGGHLEGLQIKNEVALLYSSDSDIGLALMPFKPGNIYFDAMFQLHRAALRNQVGVDFVFPESPDFGRYKLVLVPPLYNAEENLLDALSKFIFDGGTAVFLPRAGFCDLDSVVRPVRAPGALREACGISYQEFSRIESLSLHSSVFDTSSKKVQALDWIEFLELETAIPLATYEHPFFSKFPAITENHFGKGKVIYEGCLVTDDLQAQIVKYAAEKVAIENFPDLKDGKIVHRRVSNSRGSQLHFLLNYANTEGEVRWTKAPAIHLIENTAIPEGGMIRLAPWGVAILEEVES